MPKVSKNNALNTILVLLLFLVPIHVLQAEGKKCLYVSSFHPDHPSSKRIEAELKRQLRNSCKFEEHYLDGKRSREVSAIRMQALLAKQKVDSWKPDVVIVSDNIASKYLLAEHFGSSKIPFVFCGANPAVESLKQPHPNATGMIELPPIQPVFDLARKTVIPLKKGAYLGADTEAERTHLLRYQETGKKYDVTVDGFFATTGKGWIENLKAAQAYDFIVLGSREGIDRWEPTTMIFASQKYSTKLTLTNNQWMMLYALIGFTKIPEEQGAWAGRVAKEILNGASPKDIPLTSNRKFAVFINPSFKKTIPVEIPKDLEMSAEYID